MFQYLILDDGVVQLQKYFIYHCPPLSYNSCIKSLKAEKEAFKRVMTLNCHQQFYGITHKYVPDTESQSVSA